MSGTAPRLTAHERRALLLDIAAAEFAARGYAGASLRGIAQAAGVTTPVIYDHFDSKAHLYAAGAQEQSDALVPRWAAPPPRAAGDVFRVTMESIFGWLERPPRGCRIHFGH